VKQVKDIKTVIRDVSVNLLEETDFRIEARNMKRFYAMFNKNDNIIIPRIYSKISSRNVIVMEYLPGQTINDLNKEDNIDLANVLMSEFIEGVIKYGYLHADPHVGNIAFTRDRCIILYDFGTVAKYDASFQNAFKQIFQNFLKRDVEMIMKTLLEHNIIILYSNHSQVHELNPYEYVVLHNLIMYLIEYAIDPNIEKLTQKINNDQFIKPNDIPFAFNSKMVILFKSFATLEGVCKTLSKDFSYESMLSLIVMKLIDFEFINDRIQYDIESFTNPKTYNKLTESKLMLLQDKGGHPELNSIQLLFIFILILYKSFL
jgi:predicted unusual protein kinase regulating ubiquinone biosynthesis (AarF/ABC1/UbiB family)